MVTGPKIAMQLRYTKNLYLRISCNFLLDVLMVYEELTTVGRMWGLVLDYF